MIYSRTLFVNMVNQIFSLLNIKKNNTSFCELLVYSYQPNKCETLSLNNINNAYFLIKN